MLVSRGAESRPPVGRTRTKEDPTVMMVASPARTKLPNVGSRARRGYVVAQVIMYQFGLRLPQRSRCGRRPRYPERAMKQP